MRETYNLKIDTDKLFANDDPNSVILELMHMVQGYGDEYTDDLPITMTPPFEYDPDMTAIQRTMLDAYYVRQEIDPNSTAVELMSYMRTRYNIDNSYSAEEMRIIAGRALLDKRPLRRPHCRLYLRRGREHEAHLVDHGKQARRHRGRACIQP